MRNRQCRGHQVANLLLEHGAKVNTSGGGFWTPLHYASDGEECIEMVATLIRQGAEIDAPDNQGRTPLHMACRRGSATVTRALLEAGADPDEADRDGRTPVHYAAAKGRRKVF